MSVLRGFYVLFLLTCFGAFSEASTSVLPKNIDSPSFRYGTITGIGSRYTNSGTLMTLSDLKSLEMNSAALMEIEPEAKDLVAALNNFGKYRIGDNLHLGTLKIETDPTVSYFAPVYARGLSDKWTLALGLPVVTYKNKISMSSTGSNVAQIESQLRGLSDDLDSAFDRLNTSLATQAQKFLVERGYKPLKDREETFLADVQLASLYQLMKEGSWSALSKTTLNLPTGPEPDADDLAELDSFHQTAVDQQVILGYAPYERWALYGKAGIRINVPDQIEARVPEKENELPGPERKERVQRFISPQGLVGVSSDFRIIDTISVSAGYDITEKGKDSYRGNKDWNYGILEKNTDASAQRAKLGVSYDTTRAYFRKEAMMPALVSYEWNDTVAGRNIERQTVNEIWVTVFF